jgi:menaquinone-specific isochorismate synthase
MTVSLMRAGTARARTAQALASPALAWVGERLEHWQGSSQTVVLTVPAPSAPPESLLRLATGDLGMAVLWDPPGGPAYAGVGVVHRFDLRGPRRFEDLRRRSRMLWSNLVREASPRVVSPDEPRLFGGFAFDVGAAAAAPWTDFGDGCFTLPRLTYVVGKAGGNRSGGGDGRLQLAVQGSELTGPEAVERFLALLETALLELEVVEERLLPFSPELHVRTPVHSGWTEQVEAIRAGIEAGRFEKVVAARRSLVEVSQPFDMVAVLGRLAQGLRASTRFAFQRPGAVFLGASPERLVERRGASISTEAMAGSIAIGQAAELLNSGKDQEEHQLVVDAIVRRLLPLCADLEVPARPRVQELREVLHLHTPIRGRLAAPRHVLELVELLHPTPAVGGVPTDVALRWIAAHERAERGWYAAPVGWFDAAGDGEFAVALRSSVLEGRRAHLYAGAGIVRDSDPALEYQETELKKRALLRALGVRG